MAYCKYLSVYLSIYIYLYLQRAHLAAVGAERGRAARESVCREGGHRHGWRGARAGRPGGRLSVVQQLSGGAASLGKV